MGRPYSLKPEDVRKIILRHREGWTCDMIAAEVGYSYSTVYKLLDMTVKELKLKFGPEAFPA